MSGLVLKSLENKHQTQLPSTMKILTKSLLAAYIVAFPFIGLVASDGIIEQSFNDPESVPFIASEHGTVSLVRAESSISSEADGLSLYIKDTSTEGNPIVSWDLDAVGNAPLQISFDYYLDGLNKAVQAFQVRGPEGMGLLLVLSQWDGSGTAFHDGKSPQKLGKLFTKGKWYRIVLTLPPRKAAGKKFSIVVTNEEGETILERENLDFKSYLSDYNSIRFFYNNLPKSQGSSFLIDNLVVKILPADA